MGLVRKINRGILNPVAEFHGARGMERGQVRRRPAADKKSAGRLGKTAEAAEPIDHGQFDGGCGRSTEPGSIENVKPGSERIRHGADKISGTGNESEKAGMIDMQIVRKNILFQPGQKLMRVAGCLGWIA